MPIPGRSSCEIGRTPLDPSSWEGSFRLRSPAPASVRERTPHGHRDGAARSGDQHRHQPHTHRDRPRLSRLRPARGTRASTTSVPACFGPLEVALRPRRRRARRSRRAILATRPAGVWRYRELLPVDAARRAASPSAARRSSRPDASARRSASTALLIKDDTRNPTLSFKDRAVAIATARRSPSGSRRWPARAPATSPARPRRPRRPRACPAYVFVPADLEPAKIEHALAYGATVVPIDGTYDDVNRLCLEVADELGWGTVNVNLRPYYAEGSKTLAYEIAEALGWRLPGRRRGPDRLGRDDHPRRPRVRGAGRAGLGRAPRRSASSAARPPAARPSRPAFADRADTVSPVRTPDTIVRSLAIGNPADGRVRARARAAHAAARSRRSTTRRPRTRSGAPRGSRASTRRPRAA